MSDSRRFSDEDMLDVSHSRMVGVRVARIFVLLSSVYLIAVTATILQPQAVDAAHLLLPVFYVAAVAGLIYALVPTPDWLKMTWIILLTITSFGRALTLAMPDVDYLTFWQQLAASLSWFLLWLGGVLAALVLTADKILRGG